MQTSDEKHIGRERDSKIDLLKIMGICCIVIHHLVINNIGLSRIETEAVDIDFMMLFAIVNAFVVVGVNLFFLASGYLGMSGKPEKAFRIIFEIYLWWILLYVIFTLFDINVYGSIKNACISILTCFNNYWFIVVYIALMAFAPLLNKIVAKTSKKDAVCLISSFLFIECIIAFALPGGV